MINEMSLNELAEYVVTLPGWDQDIAGIQWSLYRAKVEGQRDLEPMFLPNLNSPATTGCLLAMVRKKHGQSASTEMWGDSRWSVNVAIKLSHGMHQHHVVRVAPTEAHALVAALAKEAA